MSAIICNKNIMKKLVFVACAVIIAITAHASFVIAQANDGDSGGVQALSLADLGVSKVGILPTSGWYFFKELERSIQRAFAFSVASKAKLEMKIANEKAAEILKMKEIGMAESGAMARALEGYAHAQEKVNEALKKVKKGKESAAREEILTRAAAQSEKHSELLRVLAEMLQDKGKVKENILRAEEAARGAVETSLEKAADEIDRAQELIVETEMILVEKEIALREQACTGDIAIGCSAPEISTCRNGKWVCVGPAQAGRAVEGDSWLEQSQHLLAQARERLDRALLAFDEEKYGEAYGQARAAVAAAENANRMAKEHEEMKESGDEKNEEGRKEDCICAQVYSPVCGENGKTYGNACEAKCADEDVAYAGECKADTASKRE